MSLDPFRPVAFDTTGATKTLSGSTNSSFVTLLSQRQIRFYNAGSVPVFVRWGVGAQTAVAATDMPIAPGAIEVFSKGDADTLAGITASGTATVYITAGDGE